jgi:hypothetical protein
MDTWRPLPTAYGAYPSTERARMRARVVSAIGIESSAGPAAGQHHWISVIHSWMCAWSERRGRRVRKWAGWPDDHAVNADLALLTARGQHDGIDRDRLAGPAARGQHGGIDWDRIRDQAERVP